MRKNNVLRLLESRCIPHDLHELGTSDKLSAEEVAHRLGFPPERVYKTLVTAREGKAKPILALVPAGTGLDLKALRSELGVRALRMATLEEAEHWTGLRAGGISPLALLHRGFDTVLLADAIALPRITLSAGERGVQISISPEDFIALTGAKPVKGIARPLPRPE